MQLTPGHITHVAQQSRPYVAVINVDGADIMIRAETRERCAEVQSALTQQHAQAALSDEQIGTAVQKGYSARDGITMDDWDLENVIKELRAILTAAPAVQVQDGQAVQLPRIPALPHALYEEYPAMSAKAHQDHMQEYARTYARAALASQASNGAGVVKPWKWLVSWGMGDEELCESEALAKRQKRLLEENGWINVVIEPVYRAAPLPTRTQPVAKPFPAPGEWFPVGLLGHPLREFAPGRWESAEWPSERGQPVVDAAPAEGS